MQVDAWYMQARYQRIALVRGVCCCTASTAQSLYSGAISVGYMHVAHCMLTTSACSSCAADAPWIDTRVRVSIHGASALSACSTQCSSRATSSTWGWCCSIATAPTSSTATTVACSCSTTALDVLPVLSSIALSGRPMLA